MKFYNVIASAIPSAKVNQIAITSSEYIYGCTTIGNTQCCGSVEIWGDGDIEYYFLLELLVCSNCAVFLFHLNNEQGYWHNVSIPEIEKQLNAVAPTIWKVQLKKMKEFRETLMVLEILDADKYQDWRIQKLKDYK
jgi:hypothetical protein